MQSMQVEAYELFIMGSLLTPKDFQNASPADQRQQAEAKRSITKLSVHNWLQHSNSNLGKAPTSAQVMTKYMDVSKAPMAVNVKKVGWKPVIAMTPKTRSCLKRWRRR
jgi:hypothetical protein